MISQTLTHLAVLPMQTVENPFDGLTPDFLSLGGTFEAWWQRLFVALWGLAIIVAAVYLLLGIMAMAKAEDDNPRAHKAGRTKAVAAGISVAMLSGFGIIVGAILTVA